MGRLGSRIRRFAFSILTLEAIYIVTIRNTAELLGDSRRFVVFVKSVLTISGWQPKVSTFLSLKANELIGVNTFYKRLALILNSDSICRDIREYVG